MQAMRSHYCQCEACAAELHRIEEARDILRSLPEIEPPAGLEQRILANLGIAEAPKKSFSPIWQYAAVAAVAMIAVFGTLQFRPHEEAKAEAPTYAETVDISRDQARVQAEDPFGAPAAVYVSNHDR